jgi:hypothetical protein
MSITRPTQLPEIRAELLAWLVDGGPTMFAAAIESGKQPVRPDGSPAEAGRLLAHDEARRVARAELFWVDEHMTDLVLGAADSMPAYNVLPEDLPAPAGLMVFAKPIKTLSPHDGLSLVHVRAAAWGPTGSPFDLWISWYADTELNFSTADPGHLAAEFGIPLSKVKQMPTWRQMGLPPLSYENEDQTYFSDEPLPAYNPLTGEAVTGSHYPIKELVTAWTLMKQPIANLSEAPLDRPTRRRLAKQQIDAAPVRVITLRRPTKPSGSEETDREYHHQWIVRGHWRQQWYPSREVHRPVWIAPHVKGPEGAPLLGGEKVYAWRR